jgi:protocatechuate 3,4-dioxygenase beta subunit
MRSPRHPLPLVLAAVTSAFLHSCRQPDDPAPPEIRVLVPASGPTTEARPATVPVLRKADWKPASRAAPAQVVQGQVLDSEGRPVSGANVRLLRILSVAPEPRDEQIELLQAGEDGRFRFQTPLAPGLMVEAAAPPPGPGTQRGGRSPGFPGRAARKVRVSTRLGDQVLRLDHGFSVTGVVHFDGKGVADCAVELSVGGLESDVVQTTRTSGTNGYFSFRGVPAGTCRICAHDPRYAPLVQQSITVPTGRRPVMLSFREPGSSLQGRVLAAGRGGAVAGARVSARALGMPAVVLSSDVTDEGGAFKLSGLGTGTYSVSVHHDEYSWQRQNVTLDDQAGPVAFELAPRIAFEGRLTGDLDADGLPLCMVSEDGEQSRTRSAPDGTFRFGRKVSAGAGTLAIEDDLHYFTSASRSAISIQVEERAPATHELAVSRGTRASGTVVDARGTPIAGARIYSEKKVLWIFGESLPIAETDAKGKFAITGLTPAAVTLVVQKEGYSRRSVEWPGGERGKERLLEPIVLEPAGTIRGVVRRSGGPVAGVQVFAERAGVWTVTGPDGSFVLRDVPAGAHDLMVRHSTLPKQKGKEQVVVGVGAEVSGVEIRITGGRLVEGQVVDLQDRPVADVFVGILGETGEPVYVNPDGTFEVELPPGEVELTAMTSDAQWFGFGEVEAGAKKVKIQMPLPPKASLSAKVLGLPERRACTLGILRIDPVDGAIDLLPPLSKLLRGTRTVMPRLVSMAGGMLRVERIPAGKSRLILHCPGYAPFEQVIEAKAGGAVDLGTILLEPGARLTGQVVDPTGNPVAGARAFLGEEADLVFPRMGGAGVATDAQGRFEISGVTPCSSKLVVSAEGYARTTIELSLPRDLLRKDPLVVELAKGSMIRVSVVDAKGNPVVKGGVRLLREQLLVEEKLLDEEGAAVFPHRAPGSYSLAYFASDIAKGVEVKENDKTYEVTLTWSGKK